MPKDPTKNIDRYKISGDHINEFEFQHNQQEIHEQKNLNEQNYIPGTPPEARPEVIAQKKTRAIARKSSAGKPVRKQSAKKVATRKGPVSTKKSAKTSKGSKTASKVATKVGKTTTGAKKSGKAAGGKAVAAKKTSKARKK